MRFSKRVSSPACAPPSTESYAEADNDLAPGAAAVGPAPAWRTPR